MSFRVYVAAPYTDAPAVRAIHAELHALGLEPVSHWAEGAHGPEALDTMALDELDRIARKNDRDLLSAHAILACPRDGAGAEMFAEIRLALEYGIPVVWAGMRRTLSAFRPGVVRVENAAEGVAQIAALAAVVERPWPVNDEWIRDTLWDLLVHLEGPAEVRDVA